MYNPLINKQPYGATAVGKLTTITFPLPQNSGVERVFVVLRKDGGEDNIRLELNKTPFKSEEVFSGGFRLGAAGIWHYRFEGELKGGGTAFYGRADNGDAIRGDWLPEWQLTVSKIDYKTPNWAKSGIIYHIFADRFCKGEDRPFLKNGSLHANWNERPDVNEEGVDYRADDFFGGNIRGIISKLDYIKSLGVACIYLSPIFKSSSNHRYDTGDYLEIDELFGDEKQFAELIEKTKALGINIILDGVFNHTGADSLYFNKFGSYPSLGAYQSKNSDYYDWFYFSKYPSEYHCWWGSTVVPTVNKKASGFRKLILGKDGVIEKWAKLGIKGWRLDVVDELPIEFTNELCKKIKETDNDAYIVGEVWEDATTKVSYGELRPYFMGEQLDAVMNYPFKAAITDFVMEGNKRHFVSAVTEILENYPKQSLDALMNIIGTHDTLRALTLFSGAELPCDIKERADFKLNENDRNIAKKRLKLASVLQYTLPGVPCVYYGDEAGAEGAEDPMNRAAFPWEREDGELVEHYKALGLMRRKYSEVLQGVTRFVSDKDLLIYERALKDGRKLTVYANNSGATVEKIVKGTDAITNKNVDLLILQPCSAQVIVSYK